MSELTADIEAIIQQAILWFVATIHEGIKPKSSAEGVLDGRERRSLLHRYRTLPDDIELESLSHGRS